MDTKRCHCCQKHIHSPHTVLFEPKKLIYLQIAKDIDFTKTEDWIYNNRLLKQAQFAAAQGLKLVSICKSCYLLSFVE